MTDRFRAWRRVAGIIEAAVMLGLPFLRINGESAFRFDIPSLRLHFFGAVIWMEDFFIVLVATICVLLLVILITMLFGRIWCGWACPQTVISDFTWFLNKETEKGPLYRLASYAVLLIISVVIAADLIWYFVSPYEFFSGLAEGATGGVTMWFWTVFTIVLFLNFAFLRQRFCATACPYAKLQGTLFDDRTLLIAFDPARKKECIECMSCVRACPVKIDIREGISNACIHCALCVDACSAVMKRKDKQSLINYSFGIPGTGEKSRRSGAYIMGIVTSAFFAFFLYLVISYVPLEIVALPDYSFPPRQTEDGGVVNAYILSIRNKSTQDITLRIRVASREGKVKVVPDEAVRLDAGESEKLPLYVTMHNVLPDSETTQITITAVPESGDIPFVSAGANFVFPENRP
jgi:cytochrome c oxidase accessory protein FixG